LTRCARKWMTENMKMAQPASLCSSICWSRGKRKATRVERSHVRPRRIIRITTSVGLKLRHCPHPRAIATAAPWRCMRACVFWGHEGGEEGQ